MICSRSNEEEKRFREKGEQTTKKGLHKSAQTCAHEGASAGTNRLRRWLKHLPFKVRPHVGFSGR